MAKQNFSHRANVICDRSFPGIRKCSRSRARLKELGSHRLPNNILQVFNPSLCEVFF